MIMDRLPLVQALTQAGLERIGAEHVATAIGDAIEATVATKADIARLDASIARLEASTKAELSLEASSLRSALSLEASSLRAETGRLELSIRADLQALENRMTLRLGGMLVAAIGVLFLLLKYASHAP